MTWEDFELMPKKLGWKYEYWDGQAHISPGHHVVTVTVRTTCRPFMAPCKCRSLDNNDKSQLITAYIAAFGDTIEYCDWKPQRITESANDAIEGFFAGNRGNPDAASQVAVVSTAKTNKEEVVGASLLLENKGGQPLLDMLFVVPQWRRKGLATALVSITVNELYKAGIKTLGSRYMLGNNASRAWHQKFGFKEEPDLLLAKYYCHHARQELRRLEKIGELGEADRSRLKAEIEYWQSLAGGLGAMAEKEGMKVVLPILRYG